MVRTFGIVGVMLLALSLPQQAAGMEHNRGQPPKQSNSSPNRPGPGPNTPGSGHKANEPDRKEPAPANKQPAPARKEPVQAHKAPAPKEPARKEIEPAPKQPAPAHKAPAPKEPARQGIEPARKQPAPAHKAPAPKEQAPKELKPAPKQPAPAHKPPAPASRGPAPAHQAQGPVRKEAAPAHKAPAPAHKQPAPRPNAPPPASRAPPPAPRDTNRDKLERDACGRKRQGDKCDFPDTKRSAAGGSSRRLSAPQHRVHGHCWKDRGGVHMCKPGGCDPGTDMCGDPHMQGLRGQRIDWSGVDGGWYCLVKDEDADLHINLRLTAPLPEEFPTRQLITGVSVISDGNSLVVEIEDPYTTLTSGCTQGYGSPCLANGGLRASVNGQEASHLLVPTRNEPAAGGIDVSSSNLPVECRSFGGDKLWARMYNEMLEGRRQLKSQTFEDWVLSFDHMAAPDWCAKYIAEHNLSEVQSVHALLKIMTRTVDVRLSAGLGHQNYGELNWDGRVLPDLEFWQMDVGLDGLDIDNLNLSGILGETARPMIDEDGADVMEGDGAFRGNVGDYRVAGALGTNFALLA